MIFFIIIFVILSCIFFYEIKLFIECLIEILIYKDHKLKLIVRDEGLDKKLLNAVYHEDYHKFKDLIFTGANPYRETTHISPFYKDRHKSKAMRIIDMSKIQGCRLWFAIGETPSNYLDDNPTSYCYDKLKQVMKDYEKFKGTTYRKDLIKFHMNYWLYEIFGNRYHNFLNIKVQGKTE